MLAAATVTANAVTTFLEKVFPLSLIGSPLIPLVPHDQLDQLKASIGEGIAKRLRPEEILDTETRSGSTA